MNILQLLLSVNSPYGQNVLEMVSFGLHTRHM